MKRRTLIGAIGTGTVSVAAGCLGRAFDDQGFRLGEIWVTSGYREEQRVSVSVSGEDSGVVYDEVLTLGTTPAKRTRAIKPTWPAGPDVYTLTYGRPDGETLSYELIANDDDAVNDGCMFVELSFEPATDLPSHSMTPIRDGPDSAECP